MDQTQKSVPDDRWIPVQETTGSSREWAYWVSLGLGATLVSLASLLAVVSTVGLTCGLTLDRYGGLFLLVTVLATLTTLYHWFQRKIPGKVRVGFALVLVSAAGLVMIAVGLGEHFADISGDGNWYHQEAVIRLNGGWNPVYDRLSNEGFADKGATIYAESYPHGLWIDAAILTGLTGNIDSGKAWNLILAFAVFWLALSALLSLGIGLPISFVIALATAANPVVIYQTFSYYNDGSVFALLACLIAISIVLTKRQSIELWIVQVLTIVLLIDTKFLGLIYGGGALLSFWTILWLLRADRRTILHAVTAGVIAVAAGVAVIGFSPYVLNTIRYHHPFYPVLGRGAFGHPWTGPESIHKYGKLSDFIYGVFGEPSMANPASIVTLRAPFSIRPSYLIWYRHWPDPHIGGYGVLFGEALTLSVALLLVIGIWLARHYVVRQVWAIGIVIGGLFFMVLAKECAWLARYNAHICLVPITAGVVVFWARGKFRIPPALTFGASAAIALLLANSWIVAQSYVSGQMELTDNLHSELTKIRAASQGAPVTVYFGHLRANRERWKEAGILFREVRSPKDLTCAPPLELWYSHLQYCVMRAQ